MDLNELRPFTLPKRFRSTFESEGSAFDIEVETPDLSDCTPSVWGDWGPMYTFRFEAPRKVRVHYRCEAQSIQSEIELSVATMELESPMIHARRQEHPLMLRFADPARGLEFEGYLDAEGQPARLEVKQHPLGADVVTRLLWQPPAVEGWSQPASERKVA